MFYEFGRIAHLCHSDGTYPVALTLTAFCALGTARIAVTSFTDFAQEIVCEALCRHSANLSETKLECQKLVAVANAGVLTKFGSSIPSLS